jgi:hypothetical protein
MAFVNKVNGIPIDDFLAVNPAYMKTPAVDKYGNPYLFEDGTPQYTIEIRPEYIGDNPLYDINGPTTVVLPDKDDDNDIIFVPVLPILLVWWIGRVKLSDIND